MKSLAEYMLEVEQRWTGIDVISAAISCPHCWLSGECGCEDFDRDTSGIRAVMGIPGGLESERDATAEAQIRRLVIEEQR